MNKSQCWWGGVVMALAASQSLAQGQATLGAQDNTAVPTLAPLRVQGQAPDAALPQGASVLPRAALDERGIESWEDFSKRGEPGVSFNRNNNSINIRGMDQDRVVTRVDGIRVPWLNDGARGEQGGLDTLNFNNLSSIDLVRGAGATQSGSLVGYLNLHTLSPDDLLVAGQDLGALLKAGYDSADRSWGTDAALAGRMGQGSSWLLQAGQRTGYELRNMGEVGGYGADREKANPQDYTQRNVMLKLQHDWNQEHRLSLSGEFFRRDSYIDNQRQQENGTFALGQNSTDSQNQRERVALAYSYQAIAPQSLLSTAGLSVFWQRSRLESAQEAFRISAPRGEFARTNAVQESDVGVIANAAGYVAGDVIAQNWQTGLEWVGNRNQQSSTGYDTCSAFASRFPPCSMLHTNQADVPTVKGNQWALWAQNEISWDQGKYALTPALRFDAYRQSPQAGGDYASNPNAAMGMLESSSGQRVSPSLLASYRPQDELMFYAKYGYGYKAPSATQLYMNYGAPGTYLRVGNPKLKAEVSQGWELGAEVGNDDRGANLSVFDNRYRDFIDQDVPLTANSPDWNPAWAGLYPMGVSGFVNRSRVRIYGAELAGHWGINQNWYTRGSLAWSHGRDQDTGRYLNSVAPLKAVVALGYRTHQWGAEAITTLAKRRSQVEYPQATPDVHTPDFQAPGYGLLDLTGWWAPPAAKGVRLQAGIYNVFDKKYWNALDVPRSSGRDVAPIDSYTQPGRSVRLTLSYQY